MALYYSVALLTLLVVSRECAGVVVTLGTDSICDVAFILDRLLFSHVSIPVVLTGSMKPASCFGYDGAANLEAAAMVASSPGPIALPLQRSPY